MSGGRRSGHRSLRSSNGRPVLSMLVSALVVTTVVAWGGWRAVFLQVGGGPHSRSRRQALVALSGIAAPLAPLLSDGRAVAAEPEDWFGRYKDPEYPGCRRQINVFGPKVTISGSDGVPGCIGSKMPIKKWELVGKFKDKEVEELIIDYSSRGGPKDLVATLDADGILFSDGRKWTKMGSR
eukprot:CAMPEP_0117536730 /NCGR_PEP_ID=MMETSP0784-20121206/41602_1 /TAXON_ID=39447 /ORGANISM="" /LENGTH=180 /DNA_ID=CAMNT_0005333299 /DNA_START=37 /DNA_END=579 /DNA_ORIENTATION=+